MFNSKRQKSVVGVDVQAGSVAATEVRSNGRVELVAYGVAPLPPGVVSDGEVVDSQVLGDTLKQLFSQNKLSREVRFGIASQRVAVRTLRLPSIDDAAELETAIRFQAQEHIPMPLDQAVLDWRVVERAGAPQLADVPSMDVVAVAARRDMLACATEAIRHAGLKPDSIDLSAFGMIRALAGASAPSNLGVDDPTAVLDLSEAPVGGEAAVPAYEDRVAQQEGGLPDAPQGAKLFCHLGDVVNLAVAQGTTCLFTRVSIFGVEGIAQRVAERCELTLDHARQWLSHTGIADPVEQIDGDGEIVAATREALAEGTSKLVEELRLSLEYYGAQDGAIPVEEIVACGPGTTIPGLVERLQRELGYPFSVGRPQALSHLDEATAARLTLAYGLALEE